MSLRHTWESVSRRPSMPGSEMLRLENVCAGYKQLPILHDVNLSVGEGEAVAVIGANGAGKTTLLRVIMGQIAATRGEVRFNGRPLTGLSTYHRARLGIGYAPERRELFAEMRVDENLEMGAFDSPASERAARIERIFEIFPKLERLRATPCRLLSGGEQQMVAIARALMGKPRLLLLDEPSTGLAPKVVGELYAALSRFHADGLTILVVEQNARAALQFAQRACVVEDGRMTVSGPAADLLSDTRLVEAYVGLEEAGFPRPVERRSLSADVVVLGGGNAALCAALSARGQGASVLLLEKAPYHLRGGNTRHTRDIRYTHDSASAYTTGRYTEEEFMEDLLRVTGGETNRVLAELTLRESANLPPWMERHGVHWQKPLRGALHLSRTNVFFLGGGKTLINAYYDTAQHMGVDVLYDATARALEIENGTVTAVVADIAGVETRVSCRAVVVATGGFEANRSWLKRYWGDPADNFIIRGTPHNDGITLAALLACGAKPVGDPKGAHAVAVDARSPRYDGGIITRVDAIPFGIVVNKRGRRFYDEGEELWPKRYAIWGRLVAEQPDQTAYAIVDSKVVGRYIPSVFRPLHADSLPALAEQMDVDRAVFLETVERYNRAIVKGGEFKPGELDDCATSDEVVPRKSHWALPIDAPPFKAYPLRPGITFTYLGVTVDEQARVLLHDGTPFNNVYAAGECMSGNILSRGYLAGFGLTIGSVFGRIAGKGAAGHVRV
ncbi:FAD-dependent tricarballylate dehydrogenase TcuA [bacterium]|nr:MAG: FAD-dependent tricarballylate dehydrogenase TcuA [bacterium]